MRIFLFCSFFLLSCNKNTIDPYFDLTSVKKIAHLSFIEPPPASVSFAQVFLLGANDSIAIINLINLKAVYENNYSNKYKQYVYFLYDALNQKIKFDNNDPKINSYILQTFLLNPKISNIYKANGTDELLKKYCTNINGTYELIKNNLNLEELNSISYYLFLGQYIRFNDDYKGSIVFKKLMTLIP